MELMREYPTILVINTLEIKKSTYYRHLNKRSIDVSNGRKERNRGREEKNHKLLREIRTLLKEHPLWGYRRVWAYLKYIKGYQINKTQSQKNSQEETESYEAKRDTWHGWDKVLDKWFWMDKSHNSD